MAVITGSGGGGLGRAGALLFAAHGAKVVVTDVRQTGIDDTLRLVRERGGEGIGVPADVAKLEDVRHVVEVALERYGQVDILWNNAAIQRDRFAPVEEITAEDWDATFDVNTRGYFFGVKSVAPHMKARRTGVIVMTASIGALTALNAGNLAYTASKAAVVGMTRQLAAELGPFGVRVNCLAGGGNRADGGRDGIMAFAPEDIVEPEANDRFGGLPMSPPSSMPATEATRYPSVEEFAQAALFLADPASGPLHGVVLPVDGGRTARAFA